MADHTNRPNGSPPPERDRRSLAPGAILTVAGAAGIAVLMAANAGLTPALEKLAYIVGLAWGPLLLGVAQVVLLVGLWLLWRAWRRPE